MKHIYLIVPGISLMCILGCKTEKTERPLRGEMMLTSTALPANDPAVAVSTAEDPKLVYICKSSSAARYHYDEACSGLKRCKHTIEKSTVNKAEAEA